MNTIIWSKPNCPYCVKAKELLELKKITYEERELGEQWNKQQLLEAVPNAKTVPQIFLYGKLVGGYDELKQYYEDHGMESAGDG